MAKRLPFLFLIFVIAYLALFSRLFYWQVIKSEGLSVLAREQYSGGSTIKAKRGEILASDGTWLAATSDAWLLYASIPNLNKDIDDIAEDISEIIMDSEGDKKAVDEEASRIESMLSRKKAVWVPIKHKVDTGIKSKIEELEIKGLGFDPEEARIYPEASMAAQLLGFVGKNDNGNDQGYFGLEGYYNLILSGKPGFISREEDVRGNPILLGGNSKEILPVEGVNLKTHIDKSIQLTLEQKLIKGIEKYGAVKGNGIIMDPKTGAILAMAAYPSFDPGNYTKYNNELFSNPVISSAFEPGSIFKVLVMAGGLDAGVISPDTRCPVCNGPYNVNGYSIGTWNDKYHPDATMTEVIVNSDNVGMAYTGDMLGKEKMYDYLTKFGIGALTGIDLQGEATPRLREKGKWSDVDLATSTFGQGIAVTPIQMIRAVAAIANKGVIVTPQVVDSLVSENWEEDIKPIGGERVISEKAASQITAMMIEAAQHGEAKWTNVPGFKVAGKTGTAQIPIEGHYDENKTIASFVGFAPYDDPKFVMLITLQEPQGSQWASETAAPLWYSIAGNLFNYMGIQPGN